MNKIVSILLFIFSSLFISTTAYSHTTSTSYLNLDLNGKNISGVWKTTLNDIHLILHLDQNRDSQLIWSEIINQKQKIITEFNNSVSISSNIGLCQFKIQNLMIERSAATVYLNIPFTTNCLPSSNFDLKYNFLFDQDAFHKTILSIKNYNKTSTHILSYSNREYAYNKNTTNSLYQFFEFVIQGIIHVLIGLDHVLFVICLLLSATLLKNKNNESTSLISNTFKLITAFTIAHSITLILASTKILSIPPTIIEPVIALSVIVLALLNLINTNNVKHWPIVFAFGLIHGFGFAFVLEEVPIASGTLITSLFGFNLGVEFGQLIIVLVILPALYLMYSRKYYQQLIIPALSIFIVLIGMYWFLERAFNIKII